MNCLEGRASFFKFLKGSCIYLTILLLKNGIELSPKVPYETVISP